MKGKFESVIRDSKVETVLQGLLEIAEVQERDLHDEHKGKLDFSKMNWGPGLFPNILIPISAQQGDLLYLLARAICAKTIVEFGTSFGVSTIYCAAAIRYNGNGGKVIGTEFVPGKVQEAKKNLEAAGLLQYVEIWEGDARQTLKRLPDSIDLCLMDGFPPYAFEVFKLIAPHMRKGGIVITDGIEMLKDAMGDYLEYLRDPANGFRTVSLPIGDGTEISIKE